MMNSSSLALLMLGPHTVDLSKVAVSFNTIVNFPLNAYVMFLILSRTLLAQDIFSLNLAVSEALYCLLSLSTFGLLEPNFPWHELFTEVALFSSGLVVTARPLFRCLICVEYYLGVVHPVFFLRCRPLRYRVACSGIAWLITLASCLSIKQATFSYVYRYAFFVQNMLLVSVIVFCCVSVLRALKQPGPGEIGPERRGGDPVKRRAFHIILLNMVSLVVNMLLYLSSTLLQCCLSQRVTDTASTVSTCVILLIGFTQPLLYLYRVGKLDCCKRP